MNISPTQLYDAVVEALMPHMTTEDDRRAELLPVLSRAKYARINWSGSSHNFTVRLVDGLSRADLLILLGRLEGKVGDEQHEEISQLCERVRRVRPVASAFRQRGSWVHLASFGLGLTMAASIGWSLWPPHPEPPECPEPLECTEPPPCPTSESESGIEEYVHEISPVDLPSDADTTAEVDGTDETGGDETSGGETGDTVVAETGGSDPPTWKLDDCLSVKATDVVPPLDHPGAVIKCEDALARKKKARRIGGKLMWKIDGIKCECKLKGGR